jgi:NTE family protein
MAPRYDARQPSPGRIMSALSHWNARQARVFRRHCRLYRVPPTPDLIVRLAARYAEKHARERPTASGARAAPVSLVLGGGGGRAAAHVGVWRTLHELGVGVRRVVGSSAGALVGACIATGMPWQELVARARRLPRGRIFALDARLLIRGTRSRSLLREEALRDLIHRLLPVTRFDELTIPLSINAVDLATGSVVWFGEGGRTDLPLADAVYASCALPLVFPPAAIAGERFVDGGIVDPLPIGRAGALGGERIVAVDLASTDAGPHAPGGMLDTYCRVFEILRRSARPDAAPEPRADVVRIRPRLPERSTFDLSRAEELIAVGYRASLAALTGRELAPAPALASAGSPWAWLRRPVAVTAW